MQVLCRFNVFIWIYAILISEWQALGTIWLTLSTRQDYLRVAFCTISLAIVHHVYFISRYVHFIFQDWFAKISIVFPYFDEQIWQNLLHYRQTTTNKKNNQKQHHGRNHVVNKKNHERCHKKVQTMNHVTNNKKQQQKQQKSIAKGEEEPVVMREAVESINKYIVESCWCCWYG